MAKKITPRSSGRAKANGRAKAASVRAVEPSRYQQSLADLLRAGDVTIQRAKGATNGRSLENVANVDLEREVKIPHIITFSGTSGQMGKVYRNPDEAWRHSRSNAQFMQNDLAVTECVEARIRATALLGWQITTDNPKRLADQEAIQTMMMLVNRIPRFLEYRRNALNAVYVGRQGAQHAFGPAYIDGRKVCTLTPTSRSPAWLPVHGDKLAFPYDRQGVGVRVGWAFPEQDIFWDGERARKIEMTTEYGRVYFLDEDEHDRLLVHKHFIEDGDFEDPLTAGRIHGVGLRSKIYWTWFQKQNTLGLLMEYLERSCLGFEIWTYPWGNPEFLESLIESAKNRLGEGRNIVFMPMLPGQDQYGVQHQEIGLAGAELINQIVHHFFGHQLKHYILGQTLSTEPEGGGLGSSGISDLQYGSLHDILTYDAKNLDDTLSEQLLPALARRNRGILPIGSEKMKFYYRTNTEAEKMQEQLDSINKVWQMGLRIKADDVYDKVGLEKPTEDDEVLTSQEQMAGPGGAGGMPGAGGAPAPGGPPEAAGAMGLDADESNREGAEPTHDEALAMMDQILNGAA